MIGAGIFSAAAPAVLAAGNAVLIAVLTAGLLAFLNAITMAQLASVYPESGGAYVYGRKRLGPFWGFLAGWGFVIGKMASCTAMALTFASYVIPDYANTVAAALVISLTIVNYFGVKKTLLASKILLAATLACLAVVIYATLGGNPANTHIFTPGHDASLSGILQASGLMFFSFAGYARVATLGEEVIDPEITIPRAIYISLSTTLVLYLVVISSAISAVGVDGLATSSAPLLDAVIASGMNSLAPLVRVGAALACVGVLLSLLAGVSRTVFAMASNRELPTALARVHPTHKVPANAEMLIGVVVAFVVLFADLRNAIGFSSFAVLTYYAIANIAAWTLSLSERKYPRVLALAGATACVTIAFSLPTLSVVGGVVLFAFGSAIYFIRRKAQAAIS